MQKLRQITRLLRFVWISFMELISARLVLAISSNGAERLFHIKRRCARRVIHALGVRLRVDGELEPRYPKGRLVVANHRSAIDVGILMSATGGVFLSRADVADWPLFGAVSKTAETIFVERGNKRSGAAAIREIRKRLEVGLTVLVFPEGTTHGGDLVREFRGGAFVACKGLDVDIQPVALAYPYGCEYVNTSFGSHVKKIAGQKESIVGMAYGQPFAVGEQTTSELAERAQREVQELMERARAKQGGPASPSEDGKPTKHGEKENA